MEDYIYSIPEELIADIEFNKNIKTLFFLLINNEVFKELWIQLCFRFYFKPW